jgi:hypothetical protein
MNDKRNSVLEKLKYYFDTTPHEEIVRAWEATKEWDNIMPTMNEFIETVQFVHVKYGYVATRLPECKYLIHADEEFIVPYWMIEGNNNWKLIIKKSE